MKITITKKYEYLSGWTTYDMTWKTDFPGGRNKTIQSVYVPTKNPFSTKIFKSWAAELGFDLDALFTDTDKCKEDCETIKLLCEAYNEEYGKNINAVKEDPKCYVRYTATLNPNYKPLKTAFETIEVYVVEALIEFKGNVLKAVFPSQGRKQNKYCPYILMSGGEMKELYGEEDAIYKISSRIGRLINDCDSDKKFQELPKKLMEVKKELAKYYR